MEKPDRKQPQAPGPLTGQLVCLAVDDERHMVELYADLINAHPGLHLGLATTDVNEALAYEAENHVDLAFVDIEMEEMDGLELIRHFRIHTWVIICTAYGDRGDESSGAGAAGFMKKPIDAHRFNGEVDQARRKLLALSGNAPDDSGQIILETRKSGTRKIRTANILFCYSNDEKVYAVYQDRTEEEVNKTLSELSDELVPKGFVRIHRSFLANMRFRPRYIPKSQPLLQFGKEIHFSLPGHAPNTLPIGRYYRDAVIHYLKDASG